MYPGAFVSTTPDKPALIMAGSGFSQTFAQLDAAPSVPLFFGARIYLQQPNVQPWFPALLGLHRYGEVQLVH
jgi:hypothetical protein